MNNYEIEDYSKKRESLKNDFPEAHWWFEDQLIIPQNLEEIKHLDYFENETFYIFNNAIRSVEKQLQDKILKEEQNE